jgi:hypothetical protein
LSTLYPLPPDQMAVVNTGGVCGDDCLKQQLGDEHRHVAKLGRIVAWVVHEDGTPDALVCFDSNLVFHEKNIKEGGGNKDDFLYMPFMEAVQYVERHNAQQLVKA